jgi:serine/threonine protein kinase
LWDRLNELSCAFSRQIMDAYLLHLSAFQMDCPQWELISDSAKDLIQQMLAVDPKQRITIQEVLNHRWLRVIMAEPGR